MWWSDRARTFTLAPLVAGLTAVVLAGCADGSGFRPMYASVNASSGVASSLRQVDVATIPGRVGQRVRNEIQFRFNDTENTTDPVYRLEIVLTETLTQTLVRSDGLSSSQIYMLTTPFRLIRNSDKQVIMEGRALSRAAFERNASIYSNVRAREDAENRAAKAVGTEIAERVAIFLSRPQ